MDLGTMREKVLFVTDYDYNLIDDIKEIEIKNEIDIPEEDKERYEKQLQEKIDREVEIQEQEKTETKIENKPTDADYCPQF